MQYYIYSNVSISTQLNCLHHKCVTTNEELICKKTDYSVFSLCFPINLKLQMGYFDYVNK